MSEHPNEAIVTGKKYYEALLAKAKALSPSHVEALNDQRARQMVIVLGATKEQESK